MRCVRGHALGRLLAALGFAVALSASCAPSWAQGEGDDYIVEFGVLERGGMKRLAAVLNDMDSLLADGPTSTAQLRPLADLDPDALYTNATGKLPGIFEVQRDINDGSPHQVKLSVIFGSTQNRDSFEALLTRRFGAPDDACSISGYQHWQLARDRSMRWQQLDYNSNHVEIAVRASPPLDANCVPSATDSAQLLVPEQLMEFMQRLRDELVPFGDEHAFRAWMSRYGKAEENRSDECTLSISMPAPSLDAPVIEGLNGFVFLHGQADICSGEALSALILSSQVEADMFAMDKFTAAAEAVLGSSIPGCSDASQTVWPLGEDRSFVLAKTYMSVSAYVYNQPPNDIGC